MKPGLELPGINRLHARRLFRYLAFLIGKGRTIFFILIGNLVVGGLLLSWFDDLSWLEGQYLAIITATTVGYGDTAPESFGARMVAIGIAINGLVLTGVFIAVAVKALELTYREELEKLDRKRPSYEKPANEPPPRGDQRDQ